MDRPFKRLILIPPTDREDFIEYATDAGLVYRSESQEDRAALIPYELIYSDSERQTWFHYIDDFISELRYVVVEGRDVEEGAEHVAENLPVHSDADLLAWVTAAENPKELAAAVRHLAIIAPKKCDPQVLSGFLRGLRHADPAVRVISIHACGYPAWPELKPAIRQIKDSDPDRRVRDTARRMLDVYREAGL